MGVVTYGSTVIYKSSKIDFVVPHNFPNVIEAI